MNEKDDIFGTNEPENLNNPLDETQQLPEDEIQAAQDIAERYPETAETASVSEQQPVIDRCQQWQNPSETVTAEQPSQPVYNAQPQQPFYGTQPNQQYNPQQSYSYQQPGYSYSQPYPPYQPQNNNGDAQKKKKKGKKVFCIILAIVVIIGAIAIPVSLSDKDGGNPSVNPTDPTVVDENAPKLEIEETPVGDKKDGDSLSPEEIYEKIADINVAVMIYKKDSLYTEGTGIVMGEDSTGTYTYIITCAHVISDPGIKAVIQLEDGTRYDAEIAGYDARTDIGVLKIKENGFTAAEFGNSDSLRVGSTVYAIGNPGGAALFGTFTDGKISAIGRNITSSIGYDMVCIQHNAAISPGNSGGALVNEYGQVIGINSAKIAATEYEGISFAIPITQAKEIIDKVITYGYVPGRAKLGITYVANDSSAINGIYSMAVQMMNLPSGSLVIYSIDANSALSDTEAQPGDMIISVNGKDLDKPDVLLEIIEDSSVGDVLTLELFRISSSGGRYQTETLTVKAKLIEETNVKIEETTTAGVYSNEGYGNYGSYFDDFFGFDFGF